MAFGNPAALAQLATMVRNVAARGRVTRVRHFKYAAQAVQVEVAGEDGAPQVLDRIEHVQPYGLSSRPLAGSEAVLVALGGARDATLAVQVADRRYRQTGMAEGEVFLHDHEGNFVGIRSGGLIRLNAATEVRLTSPLVKVVGELEVTGSVTVVGDVNANGDVIAQGQVSDSSGAVAQTMQEMRQAYNAHNHVGGVTTHPM